MLNESGPMSAIEALSSIDNLLMQIFDENHSRVTIFLGKMQFCSTNAMLLQDFALF